MTNKKKNVILAVASLIMMALPIRLNGQNNLTAVNNESVTTADEMFFRHMEANAMPSSELYEYEWNNQRAHARVFNIPSHYKIDLRGFSMPVKRNFITSKCGPRWGRNHNGVDLKAYMTDTIYAAFSGVVRVVRNDPKGYGNFVVIRHYNGLETVYGHLTKQLVKPNQKVDSGEPIGIAGNTGRSTGTHLHFETRFCGRVIDPQKLITFNTMDVVDDFYEYRAVNK